MKLSVIICAHNPRPDYLFRTLEALRSQTVPNAQWELVLIDNASGKPLALHIDLSWHPEGRHIREEELGLTPARLRGISRGERRLTHFHG
jgi:glycosyltransferase involved in cell wall biosynthesis